jgi:dihydropteroate synthase
MSTSDFQIHPSKGHSLNFQGKKLDLSKPKVMGILNVTMNSFYDSGKYSTEKQILRQTEKMISEGAAIIDIGAVSTKPGAEEISKKDEWQKLKPVLKILRTQFPDALLSIDTYRSQIAEESILEGAQMINDISGGTFDSEMIETIARLKVPFVIMHIQGKPLNMQSDPQYTNVVEEIKCFFENQLQKFARLGITNNIILDPGFGFGKTVKHNYQILKNLNAFREFGLPVMAGISRKSMINKVLKIKPEEALNGTTALHIIALLNGVNILRVHDVKEAVQAIELAEYYKKI